MLELDVTEKEIYRIENISFLVSGLSSIPQRKHKEMD